MLLASDSPDYRIRRQSEPAMPRQVRVRVWIVIAVAVVAAVVMSAASERYLRYMVKLEPPAQYNHPYDGRVDERVMPVAEVRALCKSVGASGPFVACAWVSDGVCHIVLPNDGQAPVSTYRRHEIAHCNGWPANHPHTG
jgi:hypothetical protein